MKALTLTQPWATAIMLRNKVIETRSRKTNYMGQIAIYAAKGFLKYAREFAEKVRALGRIPDKLPLGAIIGFATIAGIIRTENITFPLTGLERIYGDYSAGRWGWLLNNIIPLVEPIPCKGALGLWEVPYEQELLIVSKNS